MTEKKPLLRRIRAFVTENVYVSDSRLFFRSHRAFRLLAQPLHIQTADGLPRHERVFVAVTPGWWLLSWFAKRGHLDAVVARFPFGRFGNQTFQLVHTLAIAKGLGIPRALLPGNTVPEAGVHPVDDHTTWDNRPQCASALMLTNLFALIPGLLSPRAHLVGTFFHTTVFPGNMVTADTREKTLEVVRRTLGKKGNAATIDSHHLVIHIRGDDVFNDFPPKAFAQPPLAFYQVVLNDGEWSEATVVSGDQLSPILEPLFAELDKRGIPYRFQSGTLENDMAVLANAHTVVAGRGTFLPAITGLSPNTARVYCFEEDHLFRTDIDLRVVIDKTGEYVESAYRNNWRNTDEQRHLMLHYSPNHLAFR